MFTTISGALGMSRISGKCKRKNRLYIFPFRVLKIRAGDDSYEYILTNLPHDFAPEDIKECYHLRWGLETAFRYLKHAAGMLHFHSKKPELIKQEIYARLTIYNLGIFLANQAADENQICPVCHAFF